MKVVTRGYKRRNGRVGRLPTESRVGSSGGMRHRMCEQELNMSRIGT